MKQLMIATANAHKVAEFKQMLEPLGFEIQSLLDLPAPIDIEETGTSFEENALIKARCIYEQLHIPVISDDSGLAVNAMNGEPGIYSARFMGYDTSYELKNKAIIERVKQSDDKGAQFICAIAYIEATGKEHVFTGVVEGSITETIIGEQGFGYDPIFYYPPFETTLANVSEEQKNSVSHRSRALTKLIDYMKGTLL